MKNDFIHTLELEHIEIIKTFNYIQSLRLHTTEAKLEMISLKETLLKHLEKENSVIYKTLITDSPNNQYLAVMLNSFAHAIEDLPETLTIIFSNIKNNSDPILLAKYFGRLRSTIENEIRLEETFFFKEYIRLNPDS